VTITPILDHKGDVQNFIVVENDITTIKEAEENLKMTIEKERELNRFKSQFVNLASHEFRTPISVLQSSVDIMGIYLMQLDNPALKEQFEKHINVIQEELTRLKEILENILNVGRINTGAIRINHEECDVVDLIYKIIDGITLAAGARGMLKVTVLGEPIAVQIDRLLFSNVIRNIISNALKYSSGKQAPEVTISFLPESFVISVQDFGIGIPEEEQPHLFTSFFRASNTSGIPGTGLGLVLAKQFLEMQGGTIALESSVGKGCVVKLTLPVKANRDDESTGN
jgi:signal transduction histidine kinase